MSYRASRETMMTRATPAAVIGLVLLGVLASATLHEDFLRQRETYLDEATVLHIKGCVTSFFDYNVPQNFSVQMSRWYHDTMRFKYNRKLCRFYNEYRLNTCYERKVERSLVNYVLDVGQRLCSLCCGTSPPGW